MAQVIKIKQGLDIKLKGKAERSVSCIETVFFAIQPSDFVGLTPRLLVKEGDNVKVGTPLFQAKHDERIRFVSPVSGIASEIRRGPKRLLEVVIIRSDNQDTINNFPHDYR